MSKSLFRSIAVLVAVTALALPAVAANDALALVPANAVTVGMVKIAELRSSPLSSFVFEQTDQMSSDGDAAKFLEDAGLSPTKDVDLLVVATYPREALGSEADVLVIAEGRFDSARLTSALIARGAVRKGAYLVMPQEDDDDHHGAVAFPSTSLVIGGTERGVTDALAALGSGGTGFRTRGNLGLDLSRIDRNASAWALVDVTRAARLAKGKIEAGNGNTNDALQVALRTVSTVAVWATDKGDALELGAVGLSSDAETLELLEDTIRGGLAAARLAIKEKSPEMVSVLRGFDVTRKDDSITIEGSIPARTLRDMVAKKRASAE